MEQSVKEDASIVKQQTEDKISKKVEENAAVQVLKQPKQLEAGQIFITVYKARNIEKKGMFGKADPYVKITLEKQKSKSTTVKNDHNPEWNFKSSFDVDPNITENIHIEVFDEDLGKDDSLGYTSLKIDELQENKPILNQWIHLENCKSGEVFLSAEFVPLKKSVGVTQQKELSQTIVQQDISTNIDNSKHMSVEKGAKGLKDILQKDSPKNIDSAPKPASEEKIPTETVLEPSIQSKSVPASKPEKGQIAITIYKAKD